MAKKGNRVQVILECTEHKESGVAGMSRYITTKNKKNTTTINCVLLNGIGQFELDVPIHHDEILLALNHYNSTCEQYT